MLMAQIMPLQIITGVKCLPTPYTSHTTVLVNTINIMVMLRSLALLVFQTLYTLWYKGNAAEQAANMAHCLN